LLFSFHQQEGGPVMWSAFLFPQVAFLFHLLEGGRDMWLVLKSVPAHFSSEMYTSLIT
jgi:hypothetical protein